MTAALDDVRPESTGPSGVAGVPTPLGERADGALDHHDAPPDRRGPARHAPGDRSPAAVLERQRRRESSARTYARTFPIVPVRAEGMVVEGADGRRYLDCLSGAGTLALGHNHPVAREAIERVLRSGAPLHTLDVATPERDDFTTALRETLPRQLADNARVHFCGPAGTDAVEAALKLTRLATGGRQVIAFTGAYHGMTSGSLGVTADAALRGHVGGQDVYRLPYPYPYRCPFGIGGDRSADVAAAYAGAMLADSHSGVVHPAAMILEPVQGEGGVVPAPDGFLRSMRRVTRDHGIPLVVDEVQTGAGRTGTFWGVDRSGVVPDVMVLSKAIGGSLPLAVIVYTADLDVWPAGAHTGTFRGNQLAMAAGAATLREIRDAGLVARADEAGAALGRSLRELQRRHPSFGDVRGRGLMLGVEIVDPHAEPDALGARPPAPALARAIRQGCLERGLIVELGGRQGAVVRLLPPLVITDEQVEAVLQRLADAVAATEAAADRGELARS
jgi:diaminobutyrate-2-oxoglutarate transaminase